MTTPTFDQDFWQQLWTKTLHEHADKLAGRPPNAYVTTEFATLPPGRVLDAGCGHGAEALWFAAHGWQVTAVDFSRAALDHGRAMAQTLGPEVAERITWCEGDLSTWTVPHEQFDLVVSLYVHMAGSVQAMVRRLASGVAAGGALLLVGHRPIDPQTGARTAAANQTQVSVAEAVAALDPERWQVVIAEERPRVMTGTGVDAVIRARRI